MPTYDFECEQCGEAYIDVVYPLAYNRTELSCGVEGCGGTCRQVLAGTAPAGHVFHEGTYRHMTGDNATWFTSKRQLREVADQRGFYMDYLS